MLLRCLIIAVSFLVCLSTANAEPAAPTESTISRQGNSVTIRTNLTVRHYFRTYVRDGDKIYTIRLKANGTWVKRLLGGADREYVLQHFGDDIINADLDTLRVEVHGRVFTNGGDDVEEIGEHTYGEVVDQDTTPVSSSSGGHIGSKPLCELQGTCGSSGSSSGSSGSSGGSSGGYGSSSSSGSSGGVIGDRPDPVISGKTYRLVGQNVNSSLGILSNYDSILIENNRFANGRCTAVTINPCTVKNVIIRGNTFENWDQTGCGLEMVVYIGQQATHSNCTANILIENNRWSNTKTFKRAIETKTSNVVIRNNVADSRLEVRHGRNLLIENNSFGGYEIFGDNHVLRNNSGGTIGLGDGQITQDQVAPKSGYPAARNIILQNNKSPFKTFCWSHSAASGCPVKATYKVQ